MDAPAPALAEAYTNSRRSGSVSTTKRLQVEQETGSGGELLNKENGVVVFNYWAYARLQVIYILESLHLS